MFVLIVHFNSQYDIFFSGLHILVLLHDEVDNVVFSFQVDQTKLTDQTRLKIDAYFVLISLIVTLMFNFWEKTKSIVIYEFVLITVITISISWSLCRSLLHNLPWNSCKYKDAMQPWRTKYPQVSISVRRMSGCN